MGLKTLRYIWHHLVDQMSHKKGWIKVYCNKYKRSRHENSFYMWEKVELSIYEIFISKHLRYDWRSLCQVLIFVVSTSQSSVSVIRLLILLNQSSKPQLNFLFSMNLRFFYVSMKTHTKINYLGCGPDHLTELWIF